ncbi:RagB/SusD family nutrient uptake outer membrane protein [Mucilaginibacter aquariorum]|uniref:RagB/SusD family nutrient uptake outer membrane protein n=1 Tax=Mucilaginibacter aquariorum TaxID=2967225 RepID=A0ABT1SXF1_9SPHI|nr:RagB/SusD family nutrient uptake outer membrane protein [Mucilaginibacter aquariorum]MCQ6956408.1 RagB/SusD family nutrient uptake outer membrane protein [Mucilaginibacter aquariorum]
MKKIYYLLLLLMVNASCNKLELKPLDKLSETDTWSDTNLIRLYVNSTYNVLQHGFQQDLLAAACDEGFNIHGYGNLQVVQRGELTADNVSNLSAKINYFNFSYTNIRNINIFFSKIDGAPGDAAFKNGVKGEMRFLRAYLYANLVWRYGSVPLIQNVFDLHDNFNVKMSSYDDCVKFIVEELDNAAQALPADQPEATKGEASANACKALKARVLLYAASLQNNPSHDNTKWQAAADAAAALLNSGYQLNSDYQSTFTTENKEIIFARYFSQANNTNFNLEQGRNGSDGWGSQNPSQNLVNAYEMAATGLQPYTRLADGSLVLNPSSGYDSANPYTGRDPRFDASIIHDGSVWAGRVTESFHGGKDSPETNSGFNASLTSYYYKKFLIENIPPSGSTVKPTNPWIFFRYAEILLNYAEAKFELGDEATARQYLNLVRNRPSVHMPVVNDADDKLRTRIQNERRIELAFEGHRFFDVRRWKIAEDTENQPISGMDIQKAPNGSKTYTISKVIDRKFLTQQYLMPFPRAEVDKSQGSLVQNKGY